MKYIQSNQASGVWLDKKAITEDIKGVLVTETLPVEKIYEGKQQTQNEAKIKIEGESEAKNIAVNKPSINALISAFGEESTEWMNKPLTIHVESMLVGGRRVRGLYLIPEGFELTEDSGGFLVIIKKNGDKSNVVKDMGEEIPIINEEEEPSASQIPF